MNNLILSLNAVFPFLIYLGCGFLLKKRKFVDDEFLNKLNKLIFSAFFPITMFYNTHNINIDADQCLLLVCVSLMTLFILIFLSCIAVCRLVKENNKRGVIIQALYRSNIVLYALPLSESMFGNSGISLVSVLVAFFVPIYNIVAIIILEYFNGSKTDIKTLIPKILRNPLFLGAMTGILFSAGNIELPFIIEDTIETISGMTTPLALIILGGTTQLSSIKRNLNYLLPTLGFKMIILPAFIIYISRIFNFSSVELFAYFILFATPIAVGSYTMAENMGGDGRLAGELVSLSTVFSVISLFVWIFVLYSTHLI